MTARGAFSFKYKLYSILVLRYEHVTSFVAKKLHKKRRGIQIQFNLNQQFDNYSKRTICEFKYQQKYKTCAALKMKIAFV